MEPSGLYQVLASNYQIKYGQLGFSDYNIGEGSSKLFRFLIKD